MFRFDGGSGRLSRKCRAVAVPIIFTVSASQRETPMEKVARPLQRRESEPVIYPDGFDKFTSGDLQRILEPRGIKTLIITGSATNVAVLYTATAAARIHRYEVIVPVDGVNARTRSSSVSMSTSSKENGSRPRTDRIALRASSHR